MLLATAPDGAGTGPVEDRALSGPERIACAQVIVEGDVTSVRPGGRPHTVTLELAATDWIVPASGEGKARLTVPDPAYGDLDGAVEAGTRVLVWASRRPAEAATVRRGADIAEYRASLRQDMPRSRETACPDWWRDHLDDLAADTAARQ
ncbi:hypothetical protein GCM10023405_45930 [Streptomonospora salina]